jgi:hypothetical protein
VPEPLESVLPDDDPDDDPEGYVAPLLPDERPDIVSHAASAKVHARSMIHLDMRFS